MVSSFGTQIHWSKARWLSKRNKFTITWESAPIFAKHSIKETASNIHIVREVCDLLFSHSRRKQKLNHRNFTAHYFNVNISYSHIIKPYNPCLKCVHIKYTLKILPYLQKLQAHIYTNVITHNTHTHIVITFLPKTFIMITTIIVIILFSHTLHVRLSYSIQPLQVCK